MPGGKWSDAEDKALFAFAKERTSSELGWLGVTNGAWDELERSGRGTVCGLASL